MTTKYPRYVYTDKGEPVLVSSEDDEKALKGKHYESPAEAPASREKAAATPKPPALASPPVEDNRSVINEKLLPPGHEHRDRLLAEAERVGLKVDRRWSNERLQREILEFASA